MKPTNSFTLSLLASSLFALASAHAGSKLPAPDLFDYMGIEQTASKTLPKKAVKGRNHRVNVNHDLLDLDTLTLNLFDDVVVTAVLDRLVDQQGSKTWIGHVEGEQDSEVFLTVRGKTMSGTVQIGKNSYEIESKGNDQHDITQVDQDIQPKHSHSKQPEDFLVTGGQIDTMTTAPVAPTTAAATAGTIIDVLVVYTPKAKNNASGQAGIEAKITNAVAMANQAYLNSKIDMQINLVGMAETNYAETGNMNTTLTDLTGTSDGKMDEVHTLRNQVGADQVALISADANYCGIGYMMDNSWISTAFAPYAFSVVHDDSTYACLSNQTLAHEMGHNQGDNHNIEDAGGSVGAYSYSYGYRLCQTGGFRTVMSYNCTGGTRVSYFSNPNVTLSTGEVTGSAAANNAQSMTNTKAIVAAFRSGAISLPNAPGNLSANALSDSQISLTWADNANNETGFRLERSADAINWSEFAVVGSNVTNFTDTGRIASTSYYYRARAYNSTGNSNYSNIGSATTAVQPVAVCTGNPPVLAIAPNSVYSKTGAAISFTIKLTNQDSSACIATTFTLTNSSGEPLGTYSVIPAGSVSTGWSLMAPATDGSYSKSVTASATGHNNVTASATIIVDGTAPTAPGSLSASVAKRTQVNLSWSASTDAGSGVDHYDVLRNGTKVGTSTGTRYTDKPGSRGSYTYTVQAFDKAGNSLGSQKSVTF